MIQKNRNFFLNDTCCVPFTFMSAPAALLMASYVFGIAVVFSDISACAFDVNECPMLFLYKGCDSRDSGFVMRCGIYSRNRKKVFILPCFFHVFSYGSPTSQPSLPVSLLSLQLCSH